ncbi:DNA primase [Roseivivax isoporae LMG 25204]|uniref:DNA primase n=2 Tax=Roseivivax TaxID=93682 RepID=X7F5L4_9RHOB|nr:DNA primase [Roseivivax isoporae LMG 25204]
MDELRQRTRLSDVVGRKVSWDRRKSNQAKGDMWAPCPFHQEKSASFHVDDRKGFYYCFGCHAKGDLISFVRESENLGFMEAVEMLAASAGMQMPARDPRAQEKADRRTQLVEVMEQAVKFYRLQLQTGAAADARRYLEGRKLTQDALDRFEIGFAPAGWQTLWDHLTGKGVPAELILEAGLARASDRGGRPYDVFRNRIMFPIRDGRGRAVAFGARAMDPADKAKYLNSPETPLFDKGMNLYNVGPAREAAGRGAPLIVAEGYMDVIALSEGGFPAAVAPLGTAVTDRQLDLLWRIAEEPVVALDGDAAGLRAAYRVIDLALPLMEAGRSLRFALMPEGKDPDDLIRGEGPAAVQAVLDAALPMVQLLWRRETEARVFDSPERRAALDRRLRGVTGAIRDPNLRHHYDEALKDLRWALFRGRGRGGQAAGGTAGGRAWRNGAAVPQPPAPQTKASLLGSDEAGEIRLREAVILATCLTTPAVVERFEGALDAMPCRDPVHAALRDALLSAAAEGLGAEAIRHAAEAAIGAEALETLLSARHVAVTPCIRNAGDAELARLTIAEELAKLAAARGLEAEIAEAVEDIDALGDEAVTWRLREAAEARTRALRAAREDDRQYDTGANGARIDRGERESFAALMETIRFEKPRR